MSSSEVWAAIVRWRGVALMAVALVVTLWLGFTNQLILYINPRYIVFTVIMAVLALGLLLASFIARAVHSHDDEVPSGIHKVTMVVGGAVAVLLAVGMVVVPPATLSSATAIQRNVSASTVTVASNVSTKSSASNATYAKFSVLDWSSLLRQSSDPSFYAGKPAKVIGFVTPDSEDPSDLFYLTRFVITCCAVDAQPVAVPVYAPGWKSHFAANAWVSVAGGFVANPSTRRQAQIALLPSRMVVVAKPSQPYLF